MRASGSHISSTAAARHTRDAACGWRVRAIFDLRCTFRIALGKVGTVRRNTGVGRPSGYIPERLDRIKLQRPWQKINALRMTHVGDLG